MPSSPSARYDHWFVALTALVTLVIGAPVASAAESSPKRVAMGADIQIFVDENNPEASFAELREAMHRGARLQWNGAEQVAVSTVTGDRLTDEVTGDPLYDGTLELAREWGQMGIEAYKQVQTREAVDYLERSLQNFREISHDLVAPEEVSEIQMYLALSYLEDGTNVVRPIEIFQEMIRRDPSRIIESGYYPDFIVQYYENARQQLWDSLRDTGPPTEESRRIARLVDADYVFHGYAVPRGDEAVELVAYLYDVVEEELLPAERLDLSTVDPEAIEEGIGRLASRLTTCLVDGIEESGPADDELLASRGTSPISVELAMVYGSFLQVPSPITDPFGNYGVSLGGGWSVTREFQIVGNLQISNSMRDYSGLLRDNFTTVRGMIAGELGWRVGFVDFGVAAGIEGVRIGQIRALTDRDCIPDPEQLCPGDIGTETLDDHGLHWGVRIRPRIGWAFTDSFKLSGAVGFGYYFSPLQERVLNFPVTTELGVRYRF